MKKIYKRPHQGGGLEEREFWWDEEEHKNYPRLVEAIHRMPLYRIESLLADFIYYQLIGKIIVEEEQS